MSESSNNNFIHIVNDLSKTHFPVTREDGETIYIPKEYGSYDEFKKQHITNLLAERLKIFSDFKKLHDDIKNNVDIEQQKSKYLNYKDKLDVNYIVLMNNIDEHMCYAIFGSDYDHNKIKSNHILNIAMALEARLLDGISKSNVNELIKKIIDKNLVFYLGPDWFIDEK